MAKKAGKRWAADTVVTAAAPKAIKLSLDPLTPPLTRPMRADGNDAALLTARVEDADGNVMHHSSVAEQPLVTFTVTGAGKLIGLGSGDPSDHESDKAAGRHAFNGLVRAVVQATTSAGTIEVTASSPGLEPATMKITTVAAQAQRL